MARKRKEAKAKDIKLRQPDRSAPTEQTLLDFAQERNLFEEAARRQRELAGEPEPEPSSDDADGSDADPGATLSPGQERFLEAVLWTVSLATVHLTFDVLVHQQYARELEWDHIVARTARAWIVFLFLFWPLHPHEANPRLVPGLPLRYQAPLRRAVFFAMSVVCGCYLIYITNSYSYLYILKRAPPLGCLWLWAAIELDLVSAVASLAVAGGFMWYGDYGFK